MSTTTLRWTRRCVVERAPARASQLRASFREDLSGRSRPGKRGVFCHACAHRLLRDRLPHPHRGRGAADFRPWPRERCRHRRTQNDGHLSRHYWAKAGGRGQRTSRRRDEPPRQEPPRYRVRTDEAYLPIFQAPIEDMARQLTSWLMVSAGLTICTPASFRSGTTGAARRHFCGPSAPYDDTGAFAGRIRVSVPRMGVGEATATALALVVHELATNSVKYGALSTEEGVLDVSVAW